MKFNTLEKLDLPQLAELFNTAFADYIVKITLTPEILEEKIYSEDIELKSSAGIFVDEKPVGFMLHAIRETDGKKVAYNAATGVVKEFRGQNATVKMYDWLIPKLKEQNVSEILLEVIEGNTAAIKSYEKVGFQFVSKLDCFKGEPLLTKEVNGLEIREFDPSDIPDFGDWQPTWQHATDTIKKLNNLVFLGAFVEGELAGFLVGQNSKARVLQFATIKTHRRKGIGSALFFHFTSLIKNEIIVINVDDPKGETQLFLQNIDLKPFLSQLKMKLKI